MFRIALPLTAFLAASLAALAGEEAFRPEIATVSPFPREIPAGGSITFAVELRPGYHSPVFSVTRPSGETKYLRPLRAPGPTKSEFDVLFDAGPGAYRLELVADSAKGDRWAAQFTVYAGVRAPARGEEEKRRPESEYAPERADEDPFRLERDLFGKINAYRVERKLAPYPWLEPAAILARDHLRDYLALSPRPKEFLHIIPGKGCIADRFMDVYRWPRTVRKFPVENPEVGPEAVSYCSESLAAPRSLRWLFREYFLRESAFRAPLVSTFPSHAAVGIVRDVASGHLYTAAVMVQVNSTRVRTALDDEWRNAVALEERAGEGPDRAEFLRRLGRLSDPRGRRIFDRRLLSRDADVRAGALDALFLTDPDAAREFVEKQSLRLVRARRTERYGEARPVLDTFAKVRYDAGTRVHGTSELEEVVRLSEVVLADALSLSEDGRLAEAAEALRLVMERFAGFPAAEKAAGKLSEITAIPAPKAPK
ncbi:MAG: hypothetical protein MUE73_09240 [Planctomycetes bacterium]|nr:hypothetical protein [Planctomycetota bacterium]